jgi:hypothetical protein
MKTTLQLLREGRRDEIWQKYCGFIDLSLDEFMDIQRRLLMEQITLLSRCELGRMLFGDRIPGSIDEFRESVPLTTYDFYAPFLSEKRDDLLPAKPYWWLRTSGRSGEYAYKWIPYSEAMVQKLAQCSMAGLIFASCFRKGEFVFEENDIMLFALAPFPYISGAIGIALEREFNFCYVPPMEQAVQMEFQDRVREGFRLALRTGIDAFNGLASVLAKIGDQFVEGGSAFEPSLSLLHPAVLLRLVRGLLKSRLDGRSYLLPKDLWNVKCIGTGGTDTVLFKERIKEYWGREPVEAYACTEGGLMANQLWNCKGMTFYPDVCFLEFIPEEEHLKSRAHPGHQPCTVLLDELEAGRRYEIVLTNFLAGALVRYRVGDIVEIMALQDQQLGVHLPQMAFYSRADDIIDLASITRLTEKAVWQAIEGAGFAYTDWVAKKEHEAGDVVLHLYIEPKHKVPQNPITARIGQNLKNLEPSYGELEKLWNVDPLRVTLLPVGSFASYYKARQQEGADLAHLKPPHINPSDTVLQLLLTAQNEKEAGP